jgi:plasmid maintenance system antidote protein VapI
MTTIQHLLIFLNRPAISKAGFARELNISRGHLANMVAERYPMTVEMQIVAINKMKEYGYFWFD